MLNIFKKKTTTIEIKSPLDGVTKSIETVEDPVFAQKMMGEGIAIQPSSKTVVSPIQGKVKMLLPTSGHAIGLVDTHGIEILIHIGMDTVSLQGEGFEVLVNVDQEVAIGQPLITFDKEALEAKGIDCITMMVITDANGHQPVSFLLDQQVEASKDTIITYK